MFESLINHKRHFTMNDKNSNKASWRSPSGSAFAAVSQAVQVRIRYEDLDVIRAAAEKKGMPVAAFVRKAAIKEANQVLPPV